VNGRVSPTISNYAWTLSTKPVLITGGAGFVGTNLAHKLLSLGQRVIILDNLSRHGIPRNLEWLMHRHNGRLAFISGDVRDQKQVKQTVFNTSAVFHFAGQVAVTTSLKDPAEDFDLNARGTLNVLEALRSLREPPPLLFTSTNKVYGQLESIAVEEDGSRYSPINAEIRRRGINEDTQLSFHSPYGCSKGSAEQYVLDYSRNYDLKVVVFRMSCIYGPFQHGNTDQGWIAHFLSRIIQQSPITIYGDGRQVRDILYIDDLLDAMFAAFRHLSELSGQVFNIGGGAANSISLLELFQLLRDMNIEPSSITFREWRTGDQRYYVSDTGKFRALTAWRPRISVREGLVRLYNWINDGREMPASHATEVNGVRR
jgi:CDP-paratose 2-epimerase